VDAICVNAMCALLDGIYSASSTAGQIIVSISIIHANAAFGYFILRRWTS
jgi:HD-like signal output (HDOD) protein